MSTPSNYTIAKESKYIAEDAESVDDHLVMVDRDLKSLFSVSQKKVDGSRLDSLSNISSTAGMIPSANLPTSSGLVDNSVTTTKLKTATGEVSGNSATIVNLTLPGGEYGFYPQFKGSNASSDYVACLVGLSGVVFGPLTTSYVTNLCYYTQNARTLYAQQRYVTASGEDLWIFLLLDKTTNKIISAYQALDHPAYGNGGDFNKVPHPFGSYDSETQDIVLLDKETCIALKSESEKTGKSILTLVNEDYKVSNDYLIYEPLHSGRFIDKELELVKNIPNYIKVRKLKKK